MAERMKPVEAAKRLNVAPQRVYNLIKQGRVKTFSNPAGKVALVDLGEVKIVLGNVKQRGPRKEKTGVKGLPRGLTRGSIISHDSAPIKGAFARPYGGNRSVRSVVDATSHLVWLSDGTIETIWGTESLTEKIQNGHAKIEHPHSLLGVIMYQWDHEGKEVLAESLRQWAIENGVGFLPISTPHHLMEEEAAEAEAEKPPIMVEVELTDEGIDVEKVLGKVG
jgi:hypothetical protein